MALYNEVQKYYDDGLEIPEDITLLFSDDNFGSLRRLPNEQEKKRPGGSGVSASDDTLYKFPNVGSTSTTTTSNTRDILDAIGG